MRLFQCTVIYIPTIGTGGSNVTAIVMDTQESNEDEVTVPMLKYYIYFPLPFTADS
jgi:hypothetical protein